MYPHIEHLFSKKKKKDAVTCVCTFHASTWSLHKMLIVLMHYTQLCYYLNMFSINMSFQDSTGARVCRHIVQGQDAATINAAGTIKGTNLNHTLPLHYLLFVLHPASTSAPENLTLYTTCTGGVSCYQLAQRPHLCLQWASPATCIGAVVLHKLFSTSILLCTCLPLVVVLFLYQPRIHQFSGLPLYSHLFNHDIDSITKRYNLDNKPSTIGVIK